MDEETFDVFGRPVSIGLLVPWRGIMPETIAVMFGISDEMARQWVEPHIERGEN